MRAEELVEVYRAHVEILNKRKSPLEEAIVSQVAERVDGRPGWFLKHLARLLEYVAVVKGEPKRPVSAGDLESYLDYVVSDLGKKAPEALRVVRSALKDGQGVLGRELSAAVRGTTAYNLLAYENHSSQGTLEVDPLLGDWLTRKG